MPPELLQIGLVVQVRALLVSGEHRSDIGYAFERDPVADASLCGCAAVSVGVSDDPVRHVPAVASSGHADLLRVDLRILLQHLVGEVHDVVVFHCAVFASNIGELVAPAVRADRIAEEHEVAESGPVLHLMEEYLAVHRLGAAVDIQNCGILLAGIEAEGLEHPSVDIPSLAHERDLLRQRDIGVLERFTVEVADLLSFSSVQIRYVQFLELSCGDPHRDDLSGLLRDIEIVHGTLYVYNGLLLPVCGETAQDPGISPGLGEIDAFASVLHRTPVTEPAVAACGVADGCIRFVEQLFLPRIGIEPVQILILIHSVLFSVVERKDQPSVQKSASAYSVDFVISHYGYFLIVPAVGEDSVCELGERRAFAAPEDDPVFHELIAADVVLRIVDHLDLPGLLVEQEQSAAVPIDEPGAVEPERQFVADLVIGVVPDPLVFLLSVLFTEFVVVGAVLAYAAADGVNAVMPQLHPAGPEWQFRGLLSLAAVQFQCIQGSEGLSAFRPLFILFLSGGEDEQLVAVLPGEGSLLTACGEPSQLTVSVHVQVGGVTFSVLLRLLDCEHRRFPVGRITQPAEESVILEIIDRYCFHCLRLSQN